MIDVASNPSRHNKYSFLKEEDKLHCLPYLLSSELLSRTATFLPFQFIGSMEVPRPTSRVEIVAAMRRIRVSTHNS